MEKTELNLNDFPMFQVDIEKSTLSLNARFPFTNEAVLSGLRVGDRVSFSGDILSESIVLRLFGVSRFDRDWTWVFGPSDQRPTLDLGAYGLTPSEATLPEQS